MEEDAYWLCNLSLSLSFSLFPWISDRTNVFLPTEFFLRWKTYPRIRYQSYESIYRHVGNYKSRPIRHLKRQFFDIHTVHRLVSHPLFSPYLLSRIVPSTISLPFSFLSLSLFLSAPFSCLDQSINQIFYNVSPTMTDLCRSCVSRRSCEKKRNDVIDYPRDPRSS